MKPTPTPHSTHTTHKHTNTQLGLAKVGLAKVLAKVGHTTETLTLAKVALAKVGHDLAGDTNEHLKVLLDDEAATLLVTEAAEHLCVADVPGEIADALGLGALTALVKENGRIRGIVTGDTFRRGVARTMLNNAPSSKRRDRLRCGGQVHDGIGSHLSTTSNGTRCADLAHLLPFVRMFYGTDTGICGSTTRECHMRSNRVRSVSRETPSCQHCMPWASTKLSHKFMPPFVKVRCSSRIWTPLRPFSNCRSSGQLASR